MAKPAPTLFLEDWLRRSISDSSGSNDSSRQSIDASAQRIIQAWAELRDCLQKATFHPRLLDSLKFLVNSKASLYVADPQAKMLVSILSSSHVSLPHESLPLILRLLYIWVRKSSKPSIALMDLAVEAVARLFGDQFDSERNVLLFAEGLLLIGALSFVSSLTEKTKIFCLKIMCRMLEEQYKLVGSVGELIPDVLAGIGYALSSSSDIYFARLLNFLLGTWAILEVPHDISHALIILHLTEWIVFGFINSSASEKITIFIEVMENLRPNFAIFALLMATAGAIRATNRLVKQGERLNIVSRLRNSAEARMEDIASDLVSKIGDCNKTIIEDAEVRFLVHCLSLTASRSGGLNSKRGPLLQSLALALLIEVFPLRSFYSKILESSMGDFGGLTPALVNKHQEGVLFREAGATTGVFCNLYASAMEDDKCRVEDLVWSFCHDIYKGHRQVALVLKGRSDQFLNDLEKIGESAFLMVVVFALSVTKHRLTSRFSREIQINCSVQILVSLSCMEYFRRIRLPEYMEAIRSAAASVQENDVACVSFVESLPSYVDLTKSEGNNQTSL